MTKNLNRNKQAQKKPKYMKNPREIEKKIKTPKMQNILENQKNLKT